MIIALVIGCGAVFFASSNPDGLDSTFLVNEGQKQIFAPSTGDEIAGEELNPITWNAPLADYSLGDSKIGGIIALVIGIVAALAAILLVARAAYAAQTKKE
ncbi:MAG TPA: PDGLE domain-containing protein [Methanocorpusculum sp.]|nr:PDGLE domain-containing protein [Methanocorpusculum sp.]